MSDTLIDQPISPESVRQGFAELVVTPGSSPYYQDLENRTYFLKGVGKVEVFIGDSPVTLSETTPVYAESGTAGYAFYNRDKDNNGSVWVKKVPVQK